MKRLIYMFLGFVLCLVVLGVLFISLAAKNDPVKSDVETIKNVATIFKDELADLGVDEEAINNAIEKIEKLNEETKYIIAFNIKNDTNPILSTTLHLPVEEEFFNSVEIGDVIGEEEIKKIEDIAQLNKDIGSWTVVVKDKKVRE